MSDLNTILNAVSDAQKSATFSIILPSVTKGNFYSDDAINEWKMFKPLADAFAIQFAPATVYSQPLQFINWLFSHPEQPGAKKYIDHLILKITINSNLKTNQLNEIPFLLYAEQVLGQNGIAIPGHEIT